MRDQRRAIRIAVDLPARIRSTESSVDGRAGNISQHGILFVALPGELTGDPVRMEIDLPDSERPLALSGMVCWRTGRGLCGIRFTDVSLGERRRLANFVIRRACSPLPG